MDLATRMGLKLLWLRHSWTFNWAHKPLCERFRRDVLYLGRLHVCRSCTCVYAGAAVAAAAVAFLRPAGAAFLAGIAVATALTVLLSAPALYRRLPRVVRDVLRFAAGAIVPLGVYAAVAVDPYAGALVLATMAGFWILYFRLRRARKVRECDGCGEIGRGRVCKGFAAQAKHLLSYERSATELVMRSGYVPMVNGRGPAAAEDNAVP